MDDGWNKDGDKLRDDKADDARIGDRVLLERLQKMHQELSLVKSKLLYHEYLEASSLVADLIGNRLDLPSKDVLFAGSSVPLYYRVRDCQHSLYNLSRAIGDGDIRAAEFAIDQVLT